MVAHKDARQGAALAYYSVFSVGPLMVIAIGIAGLAFGQEAARGEVQGELSGMIGQPAAAAIDSMLASANKPQQGVLATAIGTAVLLFSALGVVVQLKDAFNTVWEVDEKKVGGVWQFIRTYLISLADRGRFSVADLAIVHHRIVGGRTICRRGAAADAVAGRGLAHLLYRCHRDVCDGVQIAARHRSGMA